MKKIFKYLAHFTNRDGSLGGGMDILAYGEEQAWKLARAGARRLGKIVADVTYAGDDE